MSADWSVRAPYHTKQDGEERQRADERTAWVRALRDSLPATVSA